jgi:hypothetical protein
VFLHNTKKTKVLADIFFCPLKREGASPLRLCHAKDFLTPLSHSISLDYTYTNKGESSDNLWRQWMRENPQEANEQFDNGHPTINLLIMADYNSGKKVEYLGAPYWVYDDKEMPYCEALPNQPIEDDIESFNVSVRTTIPDKHFFAEEHQNSNQQSQLPLGSVAPPGPRPMTPPPIPFGQVVTRAGSVVNPPE